jgi:Protein of unknown function (DUF3105)
MTRGAAATFAALVSAGCGGGSDKPPVAPSSATISGVTSVDVTAKQNHLHFWGPLTYAHTPPLGGAHSPAPLNCGVYSTQVPNENAVHSLEHGAVWLTYQPGVDPAPLGALTEVDRSYTLVSPYPGQPATVMATAWGLQLSADSPTDPRLRQFVETYVGNGLGGEKGARCAGVSPEEGEQLLRTPPQQNATPPPSPVDPPS